MLPPIHVMYMNVETVGRSHTYDTSCNHCAPLFDQVAYSGLICIGKAHLVRAVVGVHHVRRSLGVSKAEGMAHLVQRHRQHLRSDGITIDG